MKRAKPTNNRPSSRRRQPLTNGDRSALELLQAKEALERKTAELALSLSMMQATLDSTTDAIVVTDLDGKVRDLTRNTPR